MTEIHHEKNNCILYCPRHMNSWSLYDDDDNDDDGDDDDDYDDDDEDDDDDDDDCLHFQLKTSQMVSRVSKNWE